MARIRTAAQWGCKCFAAYPIGTRPNILPPAAAPNTTYRVFIKCGKQLGAVRTDAEGSGGRTFNYLTDALSPAYGFEIVPDGAEAGGKLQSLSLKK